MSGTEIKQLWKGTLVVLHNLKILDLNHSKNLIETPDLYGSPNLEIIDFSWCTNLCEVHPSIKELKRLQELRMFGSGLALEYQTTLEGDVGGFTQVEEI
ncbi:hypothetical protein CIPAW_14G127400 [Carya illinoinensis]|uniref:Uncharacterized protein n=1 Tax=Carya illinoinensis TaxID=32201 RepID=A0A8T1NME1_CARIL|nr:hypothetical protein CIPAW_14G127400 [Carya illinoinensis]